LRVIVVLVVPVIPPPHRSESIDCPHRATISPPGIIVLELAIGEVTSCSPRRDPKIPRDQTRYPMTLHRKPPPPPPPPPPPLERKLPPPQSTPWNQQCPAQRRPLCARHRQWRSPER
jgi:hypothetical protein